MKKLLLFFHSPFSIDKVDILSEIARLYFQMAYSCGFCVSNPSVTACAVPPPFSLQEKGGFWIGLLHTVVPLSKRLPLEAKGRTKATGTGDFFRSICPLPWSDGSQSARAGLFPAWPRSMDVQNGNSPLYARAAHCH